MRRSWATSAHRRRPVGLLLSPYATRHWLDATRGITLPIPRPRRAELAGLVREQWRRMPADALAAEDLALLEQLAGAWSRCVSRRLPF